MNKIPKIIHYCWFGNQEMSPLVTKCIESWKKKLPDYTLKLWTENNFRSSNEFYDYAIAHRQWAFAADFARIQVLYTHGGIYLDTDVLVFKNLHSFLNNNLFFGLESEKRVGSAIIGAKPKNDFLKVVLNYYEGITLHPKNFRIANTKIISTLLVDYFQLEGLKEIQDSEVLKIFPQYYFYPLSFKKSKKYVLEDSKDSHETSYAAHLWEGSWLEFSEFEFLRRREYKKGIKKMISNPEGKYSIYYFRKILSCLKHSFLNG